MISRSNMGKQLTGNRTKKMAKGGSTSKSGGGSASKSNAVKGGAAPAAKSGGSATGKTINTSSVKAGGRAGGGGMLSNITNAVRGAFAGNKKFTTVTDPKTGQSFAKPSYGAFSFKGLTSNDPANVARNRAAAARYSAMDQAHRINNRSDAEERRSLERRANAEKQMKGDTPATPTTPAAPTMVYVPAPAGYRPGIDPEHRFYQPQPTVAMKRGGKVKPKGKK